MILTLERSGDMVQKDMDQYKVVSGPYKDKAQDLKFGYEYSSGNKVGRGTKEENEIKQEKK